MKHTYLLLFLPSHWHSGIHTDFNEYSDFSISLKNGSSGSKPLLQANSGGQSSDLLFFPWTPPKRKKRKDNIQDISILKSISMSKIYNYRPYPVSQYIVFCAISCKLNTSMYGLYIIIQATSKGCYEIYLQVQYQILTHHISSNYMSIF